ncbi:MAG TPA: hypothetical protein VIU87_02670 [Mycobacterium sp.]
MSLEITAGAERPQIEQIIVVIGRQDGHSGPSPVRTLTGRRRPQPEQVSWLTGSVLKQWGHKGFPCSSRVAGSRWTPQREHVSARDLAQQLRQTRTPSRVLFSVMTRPQRGQGGRTMLCAPAPISTSISRSTEGTGASAPAPVSSSG